MERRELYFWLSAISISNVMVRYVVGSFILYDPVGAFLTTFNVSFIVWLLLYWALWLLRQSPARPQAIGTVDKIIAATSLLLSVAPLEYVGWLAVLIVGAGAWFRAGNDVDQRKAGVLLAGVTVPMFWTKIIFSMLSHYLLTWDAVLISLLTRTERNGNLVAIPGSDGYLQVLGPCSSFGNISLAYLGWLMVLCYYNVQRSTRLILWCCVIVACVVAVNTIRIALIGFFPHYYTLIHGEVGSMIVGWIYVVIIFGIANWATSTELDRNRLHANLPGPVVDSVGVS